MKNEYLLGALYNAAFMLGAVFIYQIGLRELVTHFEWAIFFGEPWFFAAESLVLPIFFAVRGNWKMSIGASLGIVIYFLALPLAFIYGD